jgi:hypothetical protein
MGNKWKFLQSLVVIGCVVAAGYSWWSHRSTLGTVVKINDKEAVNYSGDATESQARDLGKALTIEGYFDEGSEKDVLLKIKDQEKFVSFVVQDGKWDDENIRESFIAVGEFVAPAIGGLPLTIRLIDGQLKTHYEVAITTVRSRLNVNEHESIVLRGSVDESQAQVLAKALQLEGYFDGSSPATVVLDQSGVQAILSFVVQDGKWNDPSVIEYYTKLVKEVAPRLKETAISVQLLDTNLRVQKTVGAIQSGDASGW